MTSGLVGNVKKDIAELARYFNHKVVEDFKNDPKHRFQIIDSTEQHTQPALILLRVFGSHE